jgi:hypothetical protein
MNTLGVMYTCFNEKKSIEYSIGILKQIYPDIKIYLVSDGGIDFSYLKDTYNNIKTVLAEDTMGPTKFINGANFKLPENQTHIKKCALATLNRLNSAIEYCESDYMIMMDPDTLVRGKLNIPDNVKLLGTKINGPFPEEYKKVLSEVPSAKIINSWGAVPAIFHTQTYKKAFAFLSNNLYLMDKFSESLYAIFAHDVLLPTIFALIGEEEVFNPDIIECMRDSSWITSQHPLVHQFKQYY